MDKSGSRPLLSSLPLPRSGEKVAHSSSCALGAGSARGACAAG
jgi:hypothetical protein